jgi:hypothetical protein
MCYRGTACAFLRIIEGFRSQETSGNALPPETGYLACIEQSSFGYHITDRLRKKSYYIRLGSISAKGFKYRPENIDSSTDRWPRQSDGGRFF